MEKLNAFADQKPNYFLCLSGPGYRNAVNTSSASRIIVSAWVEGVAHEEHVFDRNLEFAHYLSHAIGLIDSLLCHID